MKTTELFVEQTDGLPGPDRRGRTLPVLGDYLRSRIRIAPAMAAVLATGAILTAISAWAWWRTTETFMQFLRDFRKWAREK